MAQFSAFDLSGSQFEFQKKDQSIHTGLVGTGRPPSDQKATISCAAVHKLTRWCLSKQLERSIERRHARDASVDSIYLPPTTPALQGEARCCVLLKAGTCSSDSLAGQTDG
ncbi:MAG: hypothetical protein M1829_003367 [Trizodia sp. TS-e1964]|nr:MAG: hypothetical protein M1829_003367 [Trizodia sp. TS-e1964]